MLRTTGDFIPEEALPPYLRGEEPEPAGGVRPPFEVARREALDRFERIYLAGLLEECGGNVTEAARRAGLRRTSVQRLLRRHGLSGSAFRSGGADAADDDPQADVPEADTPPGARRD
jgi:DNA-binding NtrC family response regulator